MLCKWKHTERDHLPYDFKTKVWFQRKYLVSEIVGLHNTVQESL
jgi:hypothetical protein